MGSHQHHEAASVGRRYRPHWSANQDTCALWLETSHPPICGSLLKGELWEVAQQSNRALQDELRASVRAWIWKHAAAQQYGKGLELGIEAKANGTLLKSLASYGEVTYHGMLECIMARGLWTASKCHLAGLVTSPLCPRCGLEDEDELHMLWGCQSNQDIPHYAVASTEHLRAKALQDTKRIASTMA